MQTSDVYALCRSTTCCQVTICCQARSAMSVITTVDTFDIRFPTSRELDGSDAMNPDPDDSAAYLVIGTDAGDGHEGHGFVFTIGRGNEVETSAIDALRHHILGRNVEELFGDMGGTWKLL